MTDLSMNRRDAISALLAISATGALSACSPAASETGGVSDPLRYASPTRFFSTEEMERISMIAETIIPETDTAGAIGADVPDVIQKLASEWGDDGFRTWWRNGVSSLTSALNEAANGDFRALSAEDRERVLAGYDAAVFDGSLEDEFYKNFKNTVATAYYMSEPGATEELAYEAVPGEWIGCAPLSDYPKTWAT